MKNTIYFKKNCVGKCRFDSVAGRIGFDFRMGLFPYTGVLPSAVPPAAAGYALLLFCGEGRFSRLLRFLP